MEGRCRRRPRRQAPLTAWDGQPPTPSSLFWGEKTEFPSPLLPPSSPRFLALPGRVAERGAAPKDVSLSPAVGVGVKSGWEMPGEGEEGVTSQPGVGQLSRPPLSLHPPPPSLLPSPLPFSSSGCRSLSRADSDHRCPACSCGARSGGSLVSTAAGGLGGSV